MILSELFTQVNGAYRGSDDDAPTEGTTDYNLWLQTANRKLHEWAKDTKNVWDSLFEIRQVGTVSAGQQTYELDDDFLQPADQVTIKTLDGNNLKYTLVKPQERGGFYNAVYISGRDPRILTFYDDFKADTQTIGGTINLAAYFIPDDLEKASDEIPIDDPYWLVYAVASELAFNDIEYSDKSPDLVGKANYLYSQMATANRRGTYNNPRTAPTNVSRIRGTTDNRWRGDY